MITTHREIVDYWAKREDESGLSVDWADADKLCWRCAHERQLQRCHIVPRSLGGNESPENLVLLCAQCHAEAPNVADPAFMWVWLRAHAAPFYGTYWQQRGVKEYEILYGEPPFVGLAHSDELLERCTAVLKGLFASTSTHWGQGKINPSTWAWVFRQVDLAIRDDA